MGRAIAPRRPEFDEDASVGPEADTVLGQQGTENGGRAAPGRRDRARLAWTDSASRGFKIAGRVWTSDLWTMSRLADS